MVYFFYVTSLLIVKIANLAVLSATYYIVSNFPCFTEFLPRNTERPPVQVPHAGRCANLCLALQFTVPNNTYNLILGSLSCSHVRSVTTEEVCVSEAKQCFFFPWRVTKALSRELGRGPVFRITVLLTNYYIWL